MKFSHEEKACAYKPAWEASHCYQLKQTPLCSPVANRSWGLAVAQSGWVHDWKARGGSLPISLSLTKSFPILASGPPFRPVGSVLRTTLPHTTTKSPVPDLGECEGGRAGDEMMMTIFDQPTLTPFDPGKKMSLLNPHHKHLCVWHFPLINLMGLVTLLETKIRPRFWTTFGAPKIQWLWHQNLPFTI